MKLPVSVKSEEYEERSLGPDILSYEATSLLRKHKPGNVNRMGEFFFILSVVKQGVVTRWEQNDLSFF